MARQAKLREKAGYWYSDAGGKARYFGKVGAVPRDEALRRFHAALTDDRAVKVAPSEFMARPVSDLIDRYLEWVQAKREGESHRKQSLHLRRFRSRCGSVACRDIRGRHLDEFVEGLQAKGMHPTYLHKHAVSVRSLFNRASRQGWLDRTFAPFTDVERTRPARAALLESDLPTREEVMAILQAASPDFVAMMRVYYATGARTGELRMANIRDFQPRTRQIVLLQHKRSKTMADPPPRSITLNDEALAIIRETCAGRDFRGPIFVRAGGGRFAASDVTKRFSRARRRAGVRDGITIYSMRHLWISEALMAGVDALLVARMAGTSLAMIERVYGHFRAQSFHQAQARLDDARAAMTDGGSHPLSPRA
jgi:integrase